MLPPRKRSRLLYVVMMVQKVTGTAQDGPTAADRFPNKLRSSGLTFLGETHANAPLRGLPDRAIEARRRPQSLWRLTADVMKVEARPPGTSDIGTALDLFSCPREVCPLEVWRCLRAGRGPPSTIPEFRVAPRVNTSM